MVAPHLNGANAVNASCVGKSRAQKENGDKNATRDAKPGKTRVATVLPAFCLLSNEKPPLFTRALQSVLVVRSYC